MSSFEAQFPSDPADNPGSFSLYLDRYAPEAVRSVDYTQEISAETTQINPTKKQPGEYVSDANIITLAEIDSIGLYKKSLEFCSAKIFH